MTKIKAIIIDDETDSREIIKNYLKSYFPKIKVVAEADSVKTGINALLQNTVNLLFLDIRLRDRSSFEILDQIENFYFDIIFITAYDEYAIQAIKCHAFDYLLKPLEREDFEQAVNRFLNKADKRQRSENVQSLIDSMRNPLAKKQIKLPTLSGFKLVNIDAILYLESDSNYTQIFMRDGAKITVSRNLKTYESLLPTGIFCRIHHSHIINVNCVKEYIKGRGGQVVLENEIVLNVSQSKKSNLIKHWE